MLSAVADHAGNDSALIPRIATGFGAGMGFSDGLCGALCGGIMALGMLTGRDEPGQQQKKERTYQLTKRLIEEFQRKVGSRNCSDLLGFNLSEDPEGERYEAEDCGGRICRPAAGEACALVVQIATEAGLL